jgi:hypothetical protein
MAYGIVSIVATIGLVSHSEKRDQIQFCEARLVKKEEEQNDMDCKFTRYTTIIQIVGDVGVDPDRGKHWWSPMQL